MHRRFAAEGGTMMNMTRRMFLNGLLAMMGTITLMAFPGCSNNSQAVTGTWYGIDKNGHTSTLELNEDGTWLFNGRYTASGDWNRTDSDTIVLTASLMSLSFKVDGTGDGRVLSYAGDDPSATNATGISKTVFYATESARDEAAKK